MRKFSTLSLSMVGSSVMVIAMTVVTIAPTRINAQAVKYTTTTVKSPTTSTRFNFPTAVTTWTFNVLGTSSISFSPQLHDKILRLQLTFRTRQPNGLLLHHTVTEFDKEVFPQLANYEMFLEIRQGSLLVGYILNHYQDTFPMGKALNDDRWHTLDLTLNSTSGEMIIRLDSYSKMQFLKAYLWGNAGNILHWSKLHSRLTYGEVTNATSQNYYSFTGCLRDLKYSRDGQSMEYIPIHSAVGVLEGCIDQCQGIKRCANGGRCINTYADFHCDCFGTDHEGEFCEKEGPTVLTVSGYEWVTYKLYEREEDRLLSDNNRVALEFKTGRPSGILLYAVGGMPYHNHITASINSGVLHVSVAFGDDDLDFPLGIGLDYDRWHNLTIHHHGRTVDVYLDGDVTSKTINNSNYFLSLDPVVYVGGGDNFVLTRGLPVTRNFNGCLKSIYINDQSVLYKLFAKHNSCQYHGGERPTFGCSPVRDIPISFPKAASALQWTIGSRSQNLTVDFSFRTVQKNSILFYVDLLSVKEGGSGYDYGILEVWISQGQPMMVFIPSIRENSSHVNITLPITVNDAEWHSMQVKLEVSIAHLKVDSFSRSTERYKKILEHRGQVILGYGLRRYKEHEGYVGCMEKIKIQGIILDPITVVESDDAVGLKLDGCYLIDYCSLNNFCEHGSECLSDWDGVQCDCQDNSYEGKACHFSKYKSNCDDYFQSGHTESGIYLIDVDGTGPLGPAYVKCEMAVKKDDSLFGATIVEHNFASSTAVRSPLLEDRQYHLTYRNMARSQLIDLAQASAACEQYFKYECEQSPILLGKKTWFKAVHGEVVDYLGGAQPGFCTCHSQNLCEGQRCYCDVADSRKHRKDEGFSRIKEQLPIMEMTFLQNHQGYANMTLGPLVCWGNELQLLDSSITLTTSESHLKINTWKHGELRLQFKTHQDNALILMQTSSNSNTGNRFTIKIISSREVEFYFLINGTVVREVFRMSTSLNQGDWHQISVDHDPFDVRLGLDKVQRIIRLDTVIGGVVDYDGMLFVGGLPSHVAGSLGENRPGLTGCIRGFMYNGKAMDLSRFIDGSTNGVSADCRSSCWPNPCKNGGTCKEQWGNYTCICQDPWAHQGVNCEHNLNDDAVTFGGGPNSYLLYDLIKYSDILDKTVVLSFRTQQADALLMYAYDHLSNFLQMELHQERTIVFTYNNFHTIVRGSITVQDKLNDGEWKQIIAQNYYNNTKLIYGDQSQIIEFRRMKLRTYSVDPFKDSIKKETVFITRTYEEPLPFIRLYVGGVDDGGTSTPFLKGCIRGMRMGDIQIELARGIEGRDNVTDLTPSCVAGCKANTCLNYGECFEYWKYGNFSCDCSNSDFSGVHCEKEASALLNGLSVIQHKFELPLLAQRTTTEVVMLTFKTSLPLPTNERGQRVDMALIYVKSSQFDDYILARLDAAGSILMETNQGVGLYRMKISGNFANGALHQLLYSRKGTSMYLTVTPLDSKGNQIVDGIREAQFGYPHYDLDKIDTIFIGGLLPDENQFENIANFTGCISNAVFTPSQSQHIKIRTLKDLHLNEKDVSVIGPEVTSCSATAWPETSTADSSLVSLITTENYEKLTMPAWDVGPAEVVTLSPPVVVPPTPLTTTHPSLGHNETKALITMSSGTNVDGVTVVVAVLVIAGILLLALVIVLLLLRKRRGHYDLNKEEDIELKQPLNHHDIVLVPSSPVPPDHLAKLDEFSMITAILGPKYTTETVAPNHNNRNSGSFGKMEDSDYINPIFNKRKQRPASSISEVLEELERRQQAQNLESKEEILGQPHGEENSQWDPQTDRAPLTYADITFFNIPLLARIVDENEDSHVGSFLEKNTDEKEKPEDNSPSADESHGNYNSLVEGNGDSGYEAESRPEITEEDSTPDVNGDDDDDAADELNECDDLSPSKLLISNVDNQDSPILSSPDTHILKENSEES